MEGPSTKNPKYNLARHFGNLYDLGHMSPLSLEQAEHALANPQEHLDALVEAGILSRSHGDINWYYAVDEGHKHEWLTRPGETFMPYCKICGTEGKIVPK